jgi:hypothetical protein
VDHDRELALLDVDDKRFYDGTLRLAPGELPRRHGKVSVYGFPIGGDELCISEGVVSRIEVLRYTHSQRALLALQIDAAINPGNSGGPVFVAQDLVGVAFQAQDPKHVGKSGHVVPAPIIEDFLRDVGDGGVRGVPGLGVYWQKIESDSLREFVRLRPGESGVLVTRVTHGSAAWGHLQERDVLMSIDGVDVDCDGSTPLRDEDRVNFSYLVSRHRVGETCRVGVLRDGERVDLLVQLARPLHLVARPTYVRPRYFIAAGLVFMPLTYDFLSSWSEWKDVNPRFQHLYAHELPTKHRKEVVIINEVLAHDVNVGYHKFRGVVVERVNRRLITELADVIDALKSPLGDHHLIEVDNHAGSDAASDYFAAFGTHIVLRAKDTEQATAEILARYGIERDRHLG